MPSSRSWSERTSSSSSTGGGSLSSTPRTVLVSPLRRKTSHSERPMFDRCINFAILLHDIGTYTAHTITGGSRNSCMILWLSSILLHTFCSLFTFFCAQFFFVFFCCCFSTITNFNDFTHCHALDLIQASVMWWYTLIFTCTMSCTIHASVHNRHYTFHMHTSCTLTSIIKFQSAHQIIVNHSCVISCWWLFILLYYTLSWFGYNNNYYCDLMILLVFISILY